MKGTRNLFGRFLSIVSAKVVTIVITVVTTPIIVRLLGPGGYGDYAVLLSIYALYMIPVGSGINDGVQKFVAEERDLADWREAVIRFYAVLATVLAVLGVLGLVGFTLLSGPASLFDERFTVYFLLLAAYVFVSQFRALNYRILLGFSLEPYSEPMRPLRKLGTVAVGIALVLSGFGVAGMLIGHVASNVLVAVVAGYFIVRRISLASLLRRTPNGFPTKELLSFNSLTIVLAVLVMSLFHVDVIMLRTLAGSEVTGFYKAALALAEYLWIVPIALESLLLHSTSTLWSEDRTATISGLAGRITRYTFLLVILLAVGLAVLADRFVPLYYGEEFAVATLPLLLLLPGAIGYGAARPLQAISQGSGRMKTLVAAVALPATANLLLNALLIPRFGMRGAAVATSVSYGSMFAFLVLAAWRIGYNPLADLRPGRIAATALLTAVPLLVIDRLVGHDLLALIVVPPLGFVVYVVAAVATGAVDREEVVEIAGKLPGPLGGVVESSRAIIGW